MGRPLAKSAIFNGRKGSLELVSETAVADLVAPPGPSPATPTAVPSVAKTEPKGPLGASPEPLVSSVVHERLPEPPVLPVTVQPAPEPFAPRPAKREPVPRVAAPLVRRRG